MSNVEHDPDTATNDNVIDRPTNETGSLTNLASLQENFNQQQAKISALKELVRQSEADQGRNTASAQEKVRNIAQRLTHIKTKASRRQSATLEKPFTEIREEFSVESSASLDNIQNDTSFSIATGTTPSGRARSETPGSEKIQLLRQQMEQNRLKMAERETNKRGIEQLVTQLKAKFDSSQLSLDRSHQLGSSVGDLSALSHAPLKHQSTGDLSAGFNLDRERIKYLEKRVRHLENDIKQKEQEYLTKDPESEQAQEIQRLGNRILDLEENLKEKDGIIEARTKAANLITESLSLKGKDTVDLLEETKQEMIKMQSNFVAAEDESNIRISKLEKEIQAKDKRIANLEEINDILETARFDLTLKNSELDSRTGSVEDYVNKLNELNKINETLQHRIESLENEKDESTVASSEVEHARKIQELEAKINELQSENDDLKKSLQSALNTPASESSDQERINSLEAIIAAQKDECLNLSNMLQNVQEQLTEKTVEYNVLMANFNVLDEKLKSYGPKSLFSKSTDEEAQAEINKLTKQLDDANKTSIKTKLKLKQLQKQIDTIKKASDTNKELIKLSDECQRLNDKLKELEIENENLKSQNLQSAADDNAVGGAKNESELEAKVKVLETTCQNQISAIQLLEEQKMDMTADLNTTKTELTSLKGHIKNIDKQGVTTQMDSIAYEERIDEYQKQVESLKGDINKLVAEKADLKTKLDRYIGENMELLEKIDKLSKGSSVESIEILERLTQEEKLEMERFQHAVDTERQRYSSETITEEGGELKAKEDQDQTDDLSSKSKSIDIEKPKDDGSEHKDSDADHEDVHFGLEALQKENSQLTKLIDDLRVEKNRILEEYDELKQNNSITINQLGAMEADRQSLLDNIKEIHDIKTRLESETIQLKSECDSLVAKAGRQVSSEEPRHFIDQEAYKSGLKSLTSELENYRNAKEKNAKVNASKKLARESKNVIELMESLLTSYNSCAEQFNTFKAEVEGERTAREAHDEHQIELLARGQTEDLDEKLNELKQLNEQLLELQESETEYKRKCADLEQQIEENHANYNELERLSNDKQSSLKGENDQLNEQIKSLEAELSESKDYTFQELQKQRKEFDNLMETTRKEIDILRELVEEQKQQLIDAYTEHEEELKGKESQITSYSEQVEKLQSDLNEARAQMSSANDKYVDELNEKLTSMQSLLAENKKLLDEQIEELTNKQSTIDALNQQIMDLYTSMEQHTTQLNEKDDEIEHMQTLLDKNKAELKKLNQQNLASERRAKEAENALKQKDKEIEKVRNDLENKNKEQLEKLKKFAANLKKRNAQYAELEKKCAELEQSKGNDVERVIVKEVAASVESVPLQQSSNNAELATYKETISNLEQKIAGFESETEKLRDEIKHKASELENLKLRLSEKDRVLDEITAEATSRSTEIIELKEKLGEMLSIKEELARTSDDLNAKNIKIEKCKAIIKEKNKELKRLQEIEKAVSEKQLDETSMNELKQKLDEVQNEKEKISSEFGNYRTYIEAKMQNNELVVESIESENVQLKERIGRLEENICHAEERRSSLERHSELLGSQLQQKQSQIETVEDEYTRRLKELVTQDEIIEQKLKDLEEERDNLVDTIKDQEGQVRELQRRNDGLEKQLHDLESTKLVELEAYNRELSDRVAKLEADLSKKQHEFEQALSAKHAELMDLENELSDHLQKVERERRSIQEDLEKSRDENTMLEEEINMIRQQNDTLAQDQLEAQDLRMQVVHDSTEVENLHAQNIEMLDRHAKEVNLLQAELADANNQRIAAETQLENLRLEIESIRSEFSRELDTLKAQICQDQAEIVNLRFKNDQMITDHETEVTNLHLRIGELNTFQEQMQHDHSELENLRVHKQQLENEISMLRQQVTQLDALQMNVSQNITQDQMEVHQLRLQINHDQSEIESLRHQITELDSLRMQVGQNQTDDQVFIQNENERLQSLLAEKEVEIQNYQRQNLQLQMSAASSTSDPFASFSSNTDAPDLLTLSNKVSELENRLEVSLHESHELQTKCADLQRLLMEKEAEILRLQDRSQNISSASGDSTAVIEPMVSAHQTHSLNISPFDIGSSFTEDNQSLGVGAMDGIAYGSDHGQQIEDLQRNVSDLEKYVTDLEHKLKAATEENGRLHAERLNVEKHWSMKVKQYEDQIAALNADLESTKHQLASLENERQTVHISSVDTHQAEVQRQLPSTAMLFSSPTTAENPFDEINQVPVVEDTIVPKKAYLCYPPDNLEDANRPNSSTDDWFESSWGNDAILEEQHQHQAASNLQTDPSLSVLNRASVNLQLEIDDLKAEREKTNSELNSLQAKYQKLMKKLREYKAKIDELEHSKARKPSSMETNDLDLAIQEELNSQIKSLEQRLKEVNAEHEKEGHEKKKLLSRIDVLTAANERMMEMKDKQDVEIEMCKTKIRELNGKLEKLSDWDDEGHAEKPDTNNDLAIRLTEAQNQNRLLEERIHRMQNAVAEKDDFDDEREQLLEQIRVFSAEKVLLEENIVIRDNEIAALKTQLSGLEKQNADFKATIEMLTIESNNIKTYLDRLKDEHKQKIDENSNLSERLKELADKNTDLAKQVDEMRMYNLSSENTEQHIQDLNASIQYKDSEIAAYNEKIEHQSQQFEQERQKLQDELATNERIVAELRQEISALTSEKENLTRAQMTTEKSNTSVELQQLEKVVQSLREEKTEMEAELQVLNDQVLKNLEIEDRIKSTVLELDMKNIEISELKNSLERLQGTQSTVASGAASAQEIEMLKSQLQEKDSVHQSAVDLLNAQWQQAVDQKCAEVADSWRQHLNSREEEFATVENGLRNQLEQLQKQETPNQSTANDSSTENQPSQEPSANVDQAELVKTMQSALESQEIEIVSLKEQLAIRSAEYARIAASVDPYATKSTSQSFNFDRQSDAESAQKGSELDLALYMLHQRDMRCEELTEEVIHLLEERDTLQLKLSNSIRQLEELRHKADVEAEPIEASGSSPIKQVEKSTDQSPDAKTRTQSQSDNLDLKLSELHNVKHSRDKTLYEEREQRHRQMNLLQRDVGNMPPEALAELFGPGYNAGSRATQNPSSMLLNWLWGKTPTNQDDN